MGTTPLAIPAGWEVENPEQKSPGKQASQLSVPEGWQVEQAAQPASAPSPKKPAQGNSAPGTHSAAPQLYTGQQQEMMAEAERIAPKVPGGHRAAGAYTPTPQQIGKTQEAISKWPVSPTGGMPDLGEYGNVALVGGAELLPGAAAAVNNPAVKKALLGASAAVNTYFSYQMAKGAGETTKQAFDLYKKGDYTGMAAKLGHAGVEGLLAAVGIKGLAKTAVVTGPLKPGMARDLGPKPEPEVLSGKDLGTGKPTEPASPAAAAPIDVKAETVKPLKRQTGEPHAEWIKRRDAARSSTVKPEEKGPVRTADLQAEVARAKTENERLKLETGKVPASAAPVQAAVSPEPSKPTTTHPAVLESKPLIAGEPAAPVKTPHAPVAVNPAKGGEPVKTAQAKAEDLAAQVARARAENEALKKGTAPQKPKTTKAPTARELRPTQEEMRQASAKAPGPMTGQEVLKEVEKARTVEADTKPPQPETKVPQLETSAPIPETPAPEAKPAEVPPAVAEVKPEPEKPAEAVVSPEKPPTTEAAKPEAQPATPPESKPAPTQARPEAVSAVQGIHSTAKRGGLQRVSIQPVDAAQKPVGQPIELDMTADANQEIQRVSAALGAHQGGLMANPIGETRGMRLWFKPIEAPKKSNGKLVRSANELPPKPGSNVISTIPIRGMARGSKFMYLEPGEGGHLLMTPSGQTVTVSDQDMASFQTASAGGGERGSLSFRNVPQGPERYYSRKGRIKDKVVRGLSQLEEASPVTHMGFAKLGTSRAQSAVLMRASAPRIVEALGTEPGSVSWTDFRRALIENVLRGKETMWNEMADMAHDASDAELEGDMKDWIFHLLERAHYEEKNPANTAAALLERRDFTELRRVLTSTFTDAADSVASIMEPQEYQGIVSNPRFPDGLRVYKDTIERSLKENHQSNEGVLSDFLGDLETYYPLIPIMDGDEADFSRAPGAYGTPVPFKKPQNIANRLATGLADSYSADVEDLATRIRSTRYANNKAAAIQLAMDSGLIQEIREGEEELPGEIFFAGRIFIAKEIPLSEPKTLILPSGTRRIPGKRGITPEWAYGEVIPLLDKKSMGTYNPEGLARKVTQAALIGPTDVVVHSANLIGTMVARTPFISKSLMGRALEQFPFVKRFAATYAAITEDVTSDQAARDLIEMSEYGAIPESFGSVTYSRKYAELTGAELVRFSAAPLLYGPEGIDIRARMFLHRAQKRMNPDATPTEKYLYVNQLGNYTRLLQGSWEQRLKNTMFSPFATAGMTMNRNGINTIMAMGPQAGPTPWWKRLTFGDALKVTATWYLLHKAYRGVWPHEEKDSQLLKLKLKPEDQETPTGKMLCGKVSKGSCYIDIGASSPLVGRGFRATGIAGAFSTKMAGGSVDQVIESAAAQAISSAASPIFGPPAKMAWLGITGTEPYMTGFKNEQGRLSPQFFPAVNPQPPGALGLFKQHVIPPLITVNSLFGNVGAATGLTDGIMRNEGGMTWGRLGANMVIPNLVSAPSHPRKRAEFLARQRKAEASAARRANRHPQ